MCSFREYNSRFFVRETTFTPRLAGGKRESANKGSNRSFRKDEDAMLRVRTGGAGSRVERRVPVQPISVAAARRTESMRSMGGLVMMKMAM